MMIHEITAKAGRYKARKRVGRGEGSGHGKQSGRGNKGAGSRSGNAAKKAFEGGQMPYFRRLAKFGFTNAQFKTQFWTVNLSDIVAHPDFQKGGAINTASLIKAGLVRDDSRDLKILGNIDKKQGLKAKLQVEASRVSAPARKLIVDAGGSVKETGTRRDVVRGIDRNSEDKTPKKLTKKLNRPVKVKAVAAASE
ncbi:MAG: 50S ribosomal protein L15 [Phycisphaerales bacterium]|nr:MAG: 50S ribosomal protein L15 [Phycisphaerales bacterium]